MICTAVPREAIDIVWGDVSNMLNKAIETSKGKYHIDDIYQDLILSTKCKKNNCSSKNNCCFKNI